MEYAYATLLLNESDEEINETNLTAVLEASGYTVETSRVKALVAGLEGVDLDDIAHDVDSEGIDQTGLSAPQVDREGATGKEADVDATTDDNAGTSELEPDDGATTEQ